MKKNKLPKWLNCKTNKYVKDVYGGYLYQGKIWLKLKTIIFYACYKCGIPFLFDRYLDEYHQVYCEKLTDLRWPLLNGFF